MPPAYRRAISDKQTEAQTPLGRIGQPQDIATVRSCFSPRRIPAGSPANLFTSAAASAEIHENANITS